MGLSEGLSIADAMAIARDNDDGMFGGNGSWVFFLFFLLAWGNGGMFGNNGLASGALTRAELYDGFNYNQIENGIRNIQNGLCDGFYAQNTNVLNGFAGVDRALCQGFADTNFNINNLGYAVKDCCYLLAA